MYKFAVGFSLICTLCFAQKTYVPIVREINEIYPDGSYSFAFETGNGIFAEEQGYLKEGSRVVEGQYQYTAPDGEIVRLVYTADENGFHPQGSHLPTAPPIPKHVLETLKLISKNAN